MIIYILRNVYAGQGATVRTGHGTMDCFKIRKGVRQDCISSLCLFNLYAEYKWNAGLNDSQAGIKTARRNINNLRYAGDITLMAGSEEELKSLLMKAKAAAKSLQSCPTLFDPIDGSPPGSPVTGILQARTLEWVSISFSNAWMWKVLESWRDKAAMFRKWSKM